MSSKSSEKKDFLRFSAYSFKDMVTRKFTSDTKFTDQIYEGSNLAILIDLCAYLFQGLTYCINQAASESMFSDTQIYSNISRLVKLIGYNPKGFIPSSATFQFYVNEDYDDLYIPQYAAVDTGKTDSDGNKVYYSFAESYVLGAGANTVTLQNGRWVLYPTIFTANGSNYETFVLDGVCSDADNKKYAAHGYIDVYIKRGEKFIKFKGLTDEIFLNNTSKYSVSNFEDTIDIYKNTDEDRYFSIRLNNEKTYEIKFGNDNNGQKLQAGDKVYVFYLKSNGFDAVLQSGEVKDKGIISPLQILGMSKETFYERIIASNEDQNYDDITVDSIEADLLPSITTVTNITQSTSAVSEEGVEDIRELAPDYYKLGNRLITKSDFEYYVKNRYKDNIIDVKCQNNWDYISQFYGWMFKLGLNGRLLEVQDSAGNPIRTSDSSYYIDQSRLSKYDYYYADPADENNVYLWVKMKNNIEIEKKKLDEDLNSIKVMTAEMVFVEPLDVQFAICAAPLQVAYKYLAKDAIFDQNDENYLEITISDNSLYSNTSIKVQVQQIFISFFNQNSLQLGQVVNVNDLLNQLYNINGVQRVRTVFSSKEVGEDGLAKYSDRFINGISFATWTSDVIDKGDDLEIGTSNRTLETFQFPKLYTTQILDNIKVIKKSFSNNSTVQY